MRLLGKLKFGMKKSYWEYLDCGVAGERKLGKLIATNPVDPNLLMNTLPDYLALSVRLGMSTFSPVCTGFMPD